VKEIQDTVELEEVTMELAEIAMWQCANVQSKKSGNFSGHSRFDREKSKILDKGNREQSG